MQNLRSRNYVQPTTSLRALAKLAGMRGTLSVRELLGLLGPAKHGPRPFYVIGHNTNSSVEVVSALAIGANALEIDITAYASRPTELCVAHRGTLGNAHGHDDDPSLIDFLQFLRKQADGFSSEFALVVFDVKPPAATPAHGEALLDAIRKHLVDDSNPLNIIISTGTLGLDGVFLRIASRLRPREGLMIDAEDSPTAVESHFRDTLGLRGQCYSNGSSFWEESDSSFRVPVETACWIRAQRNGFHFTYAWTVNDSEDQIEYMRIGVDGIIADVGSCGPLIDLVAADSTTRLAIRSDNPFMPPNAGYALTIKTGDDGTDANITFTLHGKNGSASTTVDTEWTRRMESGQTNYVVLQAPDLGELSSISVRSDSSGNAPEWFLETIKVESFRYRVSKHAIFQRTIDGTTPVSAPLA